MQLHKQLQHRQAIQSAIGRSSWYMEAGNRSSCPGALHSGLWFVDRAASDEPEVHDVMPILLPPRSDRERLLRHDDCDWLAVELDDERVSGPPLRWSACSMLREKGVGVEGGGSKLGGSMTNFFPDVGKIKRRCF